MENKHSRPLMINGHEVTFFVNNNVVVAKLFDYCADDAMDDTDRMVTGAGDLVWVGFFDTLPYKTKQNFLMSKHPYATAKCDPRDTFDEEYGRRLAFERLKVAYWSQYENRLGKMNDFLLKVFNLNSERMTKISEKYLQKEYVPNER